MWINLICDHEKKNYLVNLDRVLLISKQCKEKEATTDFLKEHFKSLPDYSVLFECYDETSARIYYEEEHIRDQVFDEIMQNLIKRKDIC